MVLKDLGARTAVKNTKTAKKHSNPKRPPPENGKKGGYNIRAYKYKIWQELFKKDTKAVANMIINGRSPLSGTETPELDKIEKSYKEIFGGTTDSDTEPVQTVDYGSDATYSPIKEEELREIVEEWRSTAPGPDGFTVRQLKNSNITLLMLLFNIVLYTGCIPGIWKKCRTTLIPKEGDLKNVNNWRPLTVTSVLLRSFNKILARRLNNIAIHCAQKGFRRTDGCFTNTILLQNVLKKYRAAATPYNIVTLDLKKAFDSVSHESIKRALVRIGAHQKIQSLINNMYSGCETVISCAGMKTSPIPIKRGVKQGDPISPVIFNLILDELLSNINHDRGLRIGNTSIAALAYADDLLVLGPDRYATQHTLNDIEEFLKRKGLAINVSKCNSVSTDRIPAKKKLYCATSPTLYISGTPIPTTTPEEQYKYLGRMYEFNGVSKININRIKTAIQHLHSAPLKPQQKFLILKNHIVPCCIADLQFPSITSKTLLSCDKAIRGAAKRILHLPTSTANSFFHARKRDGGLGLLSLRKTIPIILFNRMKRLLISDDAISVAVVECEQGQKLLTRLDKMMGDWKTKKAVTDFHKNDLETSYSGNGLWQCGYHVSCNKWITIPPKFWSGRDYIRAVQLRANMLPTCGIPSNPKENRFCRGCGLKQESLCHVLQRCGINHYKRIDRHNTVVKTLKKAANSAGYETFVEPYILAEDGLYYKPDIIATNKDSIVVSDVGIHWEGKNTLATAYNGKLKHYSKIPFINAIKKKFGDKNITVAPYILGARGAYCNLNQTAASLFKMSTEKIYMTILDTLKGGWTIHAHFFQYTWRK